ncbi:MAG: di-heme enzyme [Burkholderiales bacterium]|nr:di-heme enzyme [Burkholderiales bacterium]
MSTRSRRPAARVFALLAPLVLVALGGCGGGGTQVTNTGTTVVTEQGSYDWRLPAGFPVPATPADNPMSTAREELGRFLFYDTRLSGNGQQSCASCHQQDKAFTDGLATAVGSTGQAHPRNSQSIVNVAYNTTLTWANPSLSELEAQALVPIFGDSPIELGVNDLNREQILDRLRSDTRISDYPRRFTTAFSADAAPASAISWTNIIKAIAVFQRGLIGGDSRFDRFMQGRAFLSAAEERGMNLFNSEQAECFHCHTGFNFNDQVRHAATKVVETPFHNTGLYNIDGLGGFPFPNRGVYELSGKPEDMGKFRAPSLRNVAVTAPYMHDGSVGTLEEVLDFYAAGGRLITAGPHAGDGRLNPYKDGLIQRINLTEQDKADLVAFLRTLTDDDILTNPRYANPFPAAN